LDGSIASAQCLTYERNSPPPNIPDPKPRVPGRFYANSPYYLTLALLCAVVGFFPSYFARLGSTDLVHHFHGVMASLWMIMLVVQSWFMKTGLVAQHRALGKLSLVIAPAFVISGILMVHTMVSSDDGFSKAFGPRLAFLDLTTMLYFAVAYLSALYFRRNVQLHARFMSSTAILVLPPALSRLIGNLVPGISSFEQAGHGAYFVCEIVVAMLIVNDLRHGSIRAPYLILMIVLVIQQISFVLLPSFSTWNVVTTWFASI
jgi:hypothetical protein